jgi:PAS domain S-box-containing protein
MRQASDEGPAIGPQVVFRMDESGTCVLSTGPGLVDLGLGEGELVGRNLLELYGHDPQLVDSLHRVLAGETFCNEREFEGRRLWLFYQPVRNPEGTVVGAIGVSTDVTEQRRIEREVRSSRERARLLADLSPTLTREVPDIEALLQVAVRAVTRAVAEAGAIWLRASGADRLELRGLWHREGGAVSLADLSRQGSSGIDVGADAKTERFDLDDERPGIDVIHELARRFGQTSVLRVPLRSRGLLLGMVDVSRGPSSTPFTDDDVALAEDIAERCSLSLDNALLLSAEREAREQLVQFQALADASQNFVAISDRTGQVTYVNPYLEDSDVELQDDNVFTSVATHADPATADDMRRALESAGRWSGDVHAAVAGDDLVVHVDTFALSHPGTGESLGIGWIGQDVTELRTAESALRAANADLKQFKALVEASPDFIAIAGLDTRVRYVNPRRRDMIGMDPAVDVTTTRIEDYLTPEGLVASEQVEQPAVVAQGHWEGESTLVNYQGPPTPVAIASFLMRDAETGEPFALATVQRDISERLRAEAALRELAEQREALLTRLVDAQEEERTRIAADVHDDPVQVLATVDLRLGLLVRRLREQAPGLLEIVEPLQVSVSGATERLRALLFDLEPPDLRYGLTTAIRRAAEEIFGGADTHWVVAGDEEPEVPDAARAVAYRIAKEALTNVRKHAGAESVAVTLGSREGGLSLFIEDDGVGVGPGPLESSPGHRGLLNMQDRAAIAGGWCSVEDRPGGGTRVTAWLPGAASL